MKSAAIYSICFYLILTVLVGCCKADGPQNTKMDSVLKDDSFTASYEQTTSLTEKTLTDTEKITTFISTEIISGTQVVEETDNSNNTITSKENDGVTSIETLAEPHSVNEDLTEKIEKIFFPVVNNGGKYSVKMISLDDSRSFNIGNCDTPMVSASLIKLYIAGAVYENYTKVSSYDGYYGETDYLLNIMISQSDNAACNTLVTRLGQGDEDSGMSIVNRFCTNHGFNDTQMNRMMLDFNGLENYTSTGDCCRILEYYYHNDLLGSESIISFMKKQVNRTKIPAGIKDGTLVANKTGELATVENDTAIVYTDKGTYILSVISNELTDTASTRDVIAKASAVVYEDYMA